MLFSSLDKPAVPTLLKVTDAVTGKKKMNYYLICGRNIITEPQAE